MAEKKHVHPDNWCHPREGGDPEVLKSTTLDSRLRGNDSFRGVVSCLNEAENKVTTLSARLKCLLLIFLVGVLASSCATSFDKKGRYHVVRKGESIWSIAKAYRIPVQQLAEFNNIFKPSDMVSGEKLYIPAREKRSAFKKFPFGETSAKDSGDSGRKRSKKGDIDGGSDQIRTFRGKFIWPVEGSVVSLFGMRNGRRHDGIDIDGDQGDPIKAAANGKVVFSGKMSGYGNMILLRHPDDFFTSYAHNSKNKVSNGDSVKQGDVIAFMGRTGRATGTHLHFEIRHGQTARNPLFFLPERKKK